MHCILANARVMISFLEKSILMADHKSKKHKSHKIKKSKKDREEDVWVEATSSPKVQQLQDSIMQSHEASRHKNKKSRNENTEQDVWVEASPAPKVQQVQQLTIQSQESSRPEWMLEGDLFKTKEREKSKRDTEREIKQEQSKDFLKKVTIVPVDHPVSLYQYGDKGSNWRMMKLKRVYEMAEEQGDTIEEMGIDRFGVRLN